MSAANERWRWVKGYEGLYLVSDMGRVLSTPKRGHCGELRTLKTNRYGYKVVSLYKDGRGREFKVHRLVARAFIANTNNKPDVNHKNGIKTDNRAENLEWVTPSENMRHRYRVLGAKPTRYWLNKPRRFARVFTDDQVRKIRSDPRSSRTMAKELGVSKATILAIKNRRIYREVE